MQKEKPSCCRHDKSVLPNRFQVTIQALEGQIIIYIYHGWWLFCSEEDWFQWEGIM